MRRRGECRTDPCAACQEAGARYSRRNSKQRELGTVPLVDAEPARLHVKQLLADGMTVVQIQEASGVNRTAIRVLIGDFPRRKPSARIRPATAAALLAVRAPLAPYEQPNGLVDGTGTRRRIRALQASGYSTTWLAAQLGAPCQQLQIAKRPVVLASTARAVAQLYARLEHAPGPSSRTRVAARARGYLPPAWWDPDTIDDPAAEPEGVRQFRQAGRVRLDDISAPRLDRIRMLRRAGLDDKQIAKRLDVPVRYVTRTRGG